MKGQTTLSVRTIESSEDFDEARLEAIGYIFHGKLNPSDDKPAAVKAGTNMLHFARCPKLDKAAEHETKVWFRTLGIAKTHLDSEVGPGRWRLCKICEREITQKHISEQ